MKTVEFLEAIVPSDGVLFAATPASFVKNGKTIRYYKHTACPNVNELALACTAASNNGDHSFFALASYQAESYVDPRDGKTKKRTQDNVKSLRSMWLDIDCGANKPYPNQKAGLQALLGAVKAAKIPKPTFIVNSGNGIHAYWAFTKDVPKDIWQPVAKGFKATMDAVGLDADKVTANAACILRPINTYNYKDAENPKEVRLLATNDPVRFSDWAKLVRSAMQLHCVSVPAERVHNPAADKNSILMAPQEFPPSDAEVVADRCATIRAMREDKGASQDEQTWYNCLGVLRHTVQAEAVCHEWSKGHPDYDAVITSDKLSQWGDLGPTTCDTLREVSNACRGCKLKCKSPVVLGFPEPVHQTEVSQPVQPVQPAEAHTDNEHTDIDDLTPLIETLPQLPTQLEGDYAWVEGRGLTARVEDLDGNVAHVVVCSQFPVPDFIYYDDQHEAYFVHIKVRVAPNKWLSGDIPMETMQKGGINLLGALGAKCAITVPDDGKRLVRYMKTWVDSIRQNTDLLTMRSQMGWQKDGSFLLGHKLYQPDGTSKDIVVSRTLKSYAEVHQPKGTLAKQVELIDRAYNRTGYEAYQFFWAASLASPLIRFLHAHHVGFTLAGWSRDTGTGKTTVCKAGIANFGDPGGFGQSADGQNGATEYAMTLMTGIRHNLPVLVDEITGWEPKKLGAFLYRIANGTGRLQGSADGGLRDTSKYNWNSVCYVTANDPCGPVLAAASKNSQAMLARLFDVRFSNMGFDANDSRIFEELWQNTGNIGAEYVQFLVTNQDKVKKLCERNLAAVNKLADAGQDARYWMMFIAATVTALQIGKLLSLHSFDVASIQGWAIRRVKEMKFIADSSIEDVEDTMREFMSDMQSGMIVTLDEPEPNNRHSSTPFAPGYGAPRTKVTGRYIANKGTVYVPVNIIGRWCAEHNLDINELKDKLEAKTWLVDKDCRYSVGRGTSVSTTRGRCWKMNWEDASDILSIVQPNASDEDGNISQKQGT